MYAKFNFETVYSQNKKNLKGLENMQELKLLDEKTRNDTVKAVLRPYHHVNLDQEFRYDCKVWEAFLVENNILKVSRPLADFRAWCDARNIAFYTDALLAETKGVGCVFGDFWSFYQWPEKFIKINKPSIEFAELYALCLEILTWTDKLTNIKIRVYCDNQSVCRMVNHITSGCKNCMYLVRILTLDNLQKNRRVFANFIRSEENVLSDSLSRLDF